MRKLKILAAITCALPVAAIAQVGPNPSVSGGSLDPTVGRSNDAMTAPQDAGTGPATGPTGSPMDSTTSTGASATAPGADTSATTTDTTTGTTTGTHSGAKGMKKGRAPKD